MREIKFRAWDNGNSSDDNIPAMTHPQPLEAWIEQRGFYYTNGYQAELNDFDWMNELTFMQYTGLKDKNGVEIYEGDIVKYLTRAVSHLDGIIWHGRVMYKYGAFRLCRNLHNDVHSEGMGYGRPYEYEVIGNIYQNPELLK